MSLSRETLVPNHTSGSICRGNRDVVRYLYRIRMSSCSSPLLKHPKCTALGCTTSRGALLLQERILPPSEFVGASGARTLSALSLTGHRGPWTQAPPLPSLSLWLGAAFPVPSLISFFKYPHPRTCSLILEREEEREKED